MEVLSKRKALDFRTILFLNIALMTFLIVSGKHEVLITSFSISFIVLIISGEWKPAVKFLGFFAILLFLHVALLKLYMTVFHSPIILFLEMIIFLLQRICPFFMLGIAIRRSKNLGEITASLERMKLHKGIILSIIVMIRYLPAIKEDFSVIVEAMKLKGVNLSFRYVFLHPVNSIGYIMIPMLFRSMKTTEELSCAALVKGYDCGEKRTSYFNVKLTRRDMLFMAVSVCALILSLKLSIF